MNQKITKIIIALSLLILVMPTISATNIIDETELEEQNMCSQKAQRACEVLDELGITTGLGVPFVLPNNGAINMYYFDEDLIGYIIIENGLLTQIKCCEENKEATHTAKVKDLEVVEEIKDSYNFLDEAHQRLFKGDITLEAKSFTNRARLTLGKTIARISSWF